MFIRAFTVHAVTDSERAVAALREAWGFPARLGRVRLSASGASASGRVTVDGRALAEVRLRGAEACAPDTIRYDPVLNVRLAHSLQQEKRHALLEVVQLDPEYGLKETYRGRASVSYPAASEGDPWHLFPALNMISGTYTVADTELPLARFVMPY